MERILSRSRWLVAAAMLGLSGTVAAAPAPRLTNGKAVAGEVRRLTAEGLEIETPRGTVTLPWESLSPATRYRFQPGYREHYEDVLRGEPVPAGVEPDERLLALVPGTAEPAGEPSAAGATGTKPSPAPAEKPAPKPKPEEKGFKPSDFPVEKLKYPDEAEYIGLRFGPAEGDVAYLLIAPSKMGKDGKSPEYDYALVYIPSVREYRKPQKVRISQKDATCEFRSFKFTARGQGTVLDGEITCTYQTGRRPSFDAVADLTYRKGPQSVRYETAASKVRPSKNKVPGVALFGEPVLRIRTTEGGQRFFAELTLDEDTPILPVQAPETAIKVEVHDANGKVVDSENVRNDKKTYREKDSWAATLRHMKDGAQYTIRASIDLGPLGTPKAEAVITYRDLNF